MAYDEFAAANRRNQVHREHRYDNREQSFSEMVAEQHQRAVPLQIAVKTSPPARPVKRKLKEIVIPRLQSHGEMSAEELSEETGAALDEVRNYLAAHPRIRPIRGGHGGRILYRYC